jgi:hypothetical protein
MALLTARDDAIPARSITRFSNVSAAIRVDNYLGYTVEIINVCVRMADLAAANLSTQSQLHELIEM